MRIKNENEKKTKIRNRISQLLTIISHNYLDKDDIEIFKRKNIVLWRLKMK